MPKPKKTNIVGKINLGLGEISVDKEFEHEEFCITLPKFEETNKLKVTIHGLGLQKKWKVVLINELSENRCYLQEGEDKPTSKGEWKVATKFNESSSGVERTIYAIAIKEEDLETARKLLDPINVIKTISDVEEILQKKKVEFQITLGKILTYRKDDMPDKVLKAIPKNIVRNTTLAYRKVLEREPDENGLKDKAKKVSIGQFSIKDLIRELGLSDEYHRKYVVSKEPNEVVKLMFLHFLGREPENDRVIEEKVQQLDRIGWKKLVDVFVNSDEYNRKFGEDKVK